MQYTPIFFKAYELVPPSVHKARGEQQSLIVMDARILVSIDKIRQCLGKKIIVNDWFSGGSISQRGYRDNAEVGAIYSQHRFGRAIDFDVYEPTGDKMEPEEVREYIRKNFSLFPHITRMEKNTGWVHIDCASVDNSRGIIEFNR